MRTLAIMAMALSLVAVAAPAAGAAPKVPSTFMGVVADGPLLTNPAVNYESELNAMVTVGVQTERTVFDWRRAQPYASIDDVPLDQRANYVDEGGVPTDYSAIDAVVTAAAKRRIAILPVILDAPDWDARHPDDFASPPRKPQPYANFAAALARRYGSAGTFWAEHPELVKQPLRYWQIWNEPSLKPFWSDQPFAKDYVKLLKLSRTAIRGADKHAKIVLAGLPNKSWIALAQIYKAGGRSLFDIAAFHPFTHAVSGVKTILEHDRRVMARYHDSRKPLWVTELSWTSAKGKTSMKFGNEETQKGQAKKLGQAFSMLAASRHKLRIQRVYWYTWLSRDVQNDYPFDYAGLSRDTTKGIKRKPAFKAFRRTAMRLEHCRTKRTRADRCSS